MRLVSCSPRSPRSTLTIDSPAHSLLCHLSLYLLTSKSFDPLMTLQQCKLSVCLLFFFFLYFSISSLFIPSKGGGKETYPCVAFSCICYAVDLAILRIGCVHFATSVYVTDALFGMVVPRRSTRVPFVSRSCPDSPLSCPRLTFCLSSR